MATLLSTRLVPVNCDQLQLGMYVAELDRSWLQSTFPVHGFHISSEAQMEQLQRECTYVYVDPVLSDHGDGEMFSTGLTSRLRTFDPSLALDRPLNPVAQQRSQVHALGHAFALAAQQLRRGEDLALSPLRRALTPIVSSLIDDVDTIPWLIATELKVGFLHARALGSATWMTIAGRQLGFSRTVLDELALAGVLLDIGKISVPITILAKSQPLTTHERGFVERHVRRGLYMVRSTMGTPSTVEDAILGHHERLDGSGYPQQLRGTQVPIPARIAGIVDTYDALLHDRRYATALTAHDAMRLVVRLSERKFDRAIVRSFVQALGLYPTGSWLQVTDGRVGVVRYQAHGQPTRPLIALLCDADGRPLPGGPKLWQPVRHSDIRRPLRGGAAPILRATLNELLVASAELHNPLADTLAA